jgi:hypothetical protein
MKNKLIIQNGVEVQHIHGAKEKPYSTPALRIQSD